MFAARAGASRVIVIDFSDMAFFASQIVKANGLESKVTILHGDYLNLRFFVNAPFDHDCSDYSFHGL